MRDRERDRDRDREREREIICLSIREDYLSGTIL